MLKVSNISFQYAPKKEILSAISFTLEEGQHLCVMGESGSGKSTLLKAVYGLLDLKKGSIYWKNQEVLGEASSGNTGHLVRKMSRAKRATDICRILGAKIQIISINQLKILKMNQTRFARSVFCRPETSIMSWLELH